MPFLKQKLSIVLLISGGLVMTGWVRQCSAAQVTTAKSEAHIGFYQENSQKSSHATVRQKLTTNQTKLPQTSSQMSQVNLIIGLNLSLVSGGLLIQKRGRQYNEKNNN